MKVSFGRACSVALLLLTGSISGLAGAADTLSRIRETQTLTIAHRESSVPFSYIPEGSKQPTGYSVDICLKIADAIKKELRLPNLKLNYLPVSSNNRIQAIMDGKADIECGSTTNNAERRKQVSFTIPHFFSTTRMIVRADSGIKNWTDLKDKKVVTTRGSTTVKLLTERDRVRSLNVRVLEGNDHAESFGMVEKFQADAFAMDDVLLFGFRATAKDPEKYVVVGEPLSMEPYSMMIHKDDKAFKDLVDREISRLMTDGEISKLYDKWFKKPVPPKNTVLNMPMNYLLRDTIRFPTDKVAD